MKHFTFTRHSVAAFVKLIAALGIQPLPPSSADIVSYLITALDVTSRREQDHQCHQLLRRQRQQSASLSTLQERLAFISQEGTVPAPAVVAAAREQLARQTEEASHSVSRKSGFMASMTHELRTPLNAIQGFSSVLLALGDLPERSEYVRILRNSSDMLQRLINDIIEASRITDGAPLAITPKRCDFSSRFDDMCITLRQRIQNNAVDFVIDNPSEHLYITVDAERVMQILTNFVTNAVKFTSKGHIRVGYSYEDGGLRVYCEDTGIGIPCDKQDVIFERFVKLDEFVQGTGMGLAISKSIAESCGGRIGVKSDGKDNGSTFWTWIPCEAD